MKHFQSKLREIHKSFDQLEIKLVYIVKDKFDLIDNSCINRMIDVYRYRFFKINNHKSQLLNKLYKSDHFQLRRSIFTFDER